MHSRAEQIERVCDVSFFYDTQPGDKSMRHTAAGKLLCFSRGCCSHPFADVCGGRHHSVEVPLSAAPLAPRTALLLLLLLPRPCGRGSSRAAPAAPASNIAGVVSLPLLSQRRAYHILCRRHPEQQLMLQPHQPRLPLHAAVAVFIVDSGEGGGAEAVVVEMRNEECPHRGEISRSTQQYIFG